MARGRAVDPINDALVKEKAKEVSYLIYKEIEKNDIKMSAYDFSYKLSVSNGQASRIFNGGEGGRPFHYGVLEITQLAIYFSSKDFFLNLLFVLYPEDKFAFPLIGNDNFSLFLHMRDIRLGWLYEHLEDEKYKEIKKEDRCLRLQTDLDDFCNKKH